MKKYTLTALVLMLIAGICAALIASVNLLTAPIIEKNNGDKTKYRISSDKCHGRCHFRRYWYQSTI